MRIKRKKWFQLRISHDPHNTAWDTTGQSTQGTFEHGNALRSCFCDHNGGTSATNGTSYLGRPWFASLRHLLSCRDPQGEIATIISFRILEVVGISRGYETVVAADLPGRLVFFVDVYSFFRDKRFQRIRCTAIA